MKRKLGPEISRIRQEKGLSQKNLATGCCSQAAISKIEKGQHMPNMETLKHISDRLNTPVEHFIKLSTYENADYIDEVVNQIEDASARHDYQQVYDITAYELKGNVKNKNSTWYGIVLQWNHLFAAYKLNKTNSEEVIRQLSVLLDKSTSVTSKMEDVHARILNTTAIIWGESKKYENSLSYFQQALDNMNQAEYPHPSRDGRIFHIRLCYNKAKTLYDFGKYNESLDDIKHGISLCRKYENMSLLGQLLYYKGQCFEKTEQPFEDIQNCYRQALQIFDFLQKHSYSKIVRELKKEYL